MPAPAAERRIPQGAEIRPFLQVFPIEIARRTGGSFETFSGMPFRIKYDSLGAEIIPNSTHPADLRPGQKTASVFRLYTGLGEERHPLDRTMVILDEESVIFVYPIQYSRVHGGCGRYFWLIISKKEGITFHVRVEREGEDGELGSIDPKIKEAAELARRVSVR